MSLNKEYYVMDMKFDDTYPLLAPYNECLHTYEYITEDDEIDEPEVTEFQLRHPIPKKPIFGDYLEALGKPIISSKIKNILGENIFKLQFIPAIIYDNKGNILENYFFMNIYNMIMAVNRSKSDYELRFEDDPDTLSLNYFRLDETLLASIPYENRLFFLLKESTLKKIVHESIVEKILSVIPKGIGFTPVEKWSF